MNKLGILLIIAFLQLAGGVPVACAQIPDNLLPDSLGVTDQFQETFFEALKEKGVGNHDKAIPLLLECLELQPELAVLQHELAKAYLEEGRIPEATAAAAQALHAEPAEFWYLQTWVATNLAGERSLAHMRTQLQELDPSLLEQFALALFRSGAFRETLEVLETLPSSPGNQLLQEKARESLPDIPEEAPAEPPEDPVQQLHSDFARWLQEGDYEQLGEASSEALESYPAQPYFYFVRGMVLAQEEAYEEAVTVLEEGLLYVLDDRELEQRFYRELASLCTALGEVSKANMYLSKIQ